MEKSIEVLKNLIKDNTNRCVNTEGENFMGPSPRQRTRPLRNAESGRIGLPQG